MREKKGGKPGFRKNRETERKRHAPSKGAASDRESADAYRGKLRDAVIRDRKSDAAGVAKLQSQGFGVVTALVAEIDIGRSTTAANALFAVIEYGIWILNSRIAVGSSDLIHEIAAGQTLWPVMLARHKDKLAEAEAFMRKIGLGSRTGVGYENRRGFGWKNETEFSIGLYLELLNWKNDPQTRAHFARCGDPELKWQRLAMKLPSLSRNKSVQKQWWEAVDALFVNTYPKDFENLPCFKRYWQNKSASGIADHTKRAQVRRDIKKAIKQGLLSIARHR